MCSPGVDPRGRGQDPLHFWWTQHIYKTKTVARMPDVLQLNLYLDPILVSRYLPCNLVRNIIILFYFEAVSEYRVVVIFYIFQCSDSTGKHDEIVRYVVGINK